VRLSLQGCLILWLGLVSFSAKAELYGWNTADLSYPTPDAACEAYVSDQLASHEMVKVERSNGGQPATSSPSQWGACFYRHRTNTWQGGSRSLYWVAGDTCNEAWMHEANPITGAQPTGECSCNTSHRKRR